MAAISKHIDFTGKILAAIELGETNIIADIAADSFTELRRTTAQSAIKTREELDTVIASILKEVDTHYEGDMLERQQGLFATELLRVEQALLTGSSKGAMIEGRKNDEGPNTYSPERQLLWHAVWTHIASQESIGTSVIKHELADSKGMRAQLDEFAFQLSSVLGMVGSSAKECEIIWGDKGSGYYHAQKSKNPALNKDRINIDLHGTLGEGQHVLQIMLHEFMHHLVDRNYPPYLQEMQKKITELLPRYNEGKLSEDELEEFKALVIKRDLSHRVWNSAADNAVDNGSVVLARGFYEDLQGGFPKVDPSLLINSFTTRGMGNHYVKLQSPHTEEPENPLAALLGGGKPNPVTALSNSLFVISQIHHGLVPNTPEGLASIGIEPSQFPHKDHPEWTPKQNWQFLWDKCQALMQHVPGLQTMDMLDKTAWRAARDAAEAERNKIHTEIFEAYVEPHLEQIVEQQKKQEELMKKLMEALGDLPQTPGSGAPGKGIPIPGGLGEAEPITVEQGGKNKTDGTNAEPDPKGDKGTKPKLGGGNFAQPSAPNAAAGSGTDALINLPLGDGRTLKELQEDSAIKRAITQLAREIVKLYRDAPIYQMGHGTNSHTLTPQGGSIPELFDRDKHRRILEQGGPQALDDFRGFRGQQPVAKIPAVGDFILALDTSGSMGWGKNTHAEHAVKSAAIMALAIQKANDILQRENQGPEVGTYVMLWGNSTPSFLTKPYDKKSIHRMIDQMDVLLQRVWSGSSLEGAHGGTEMVGVAKAVSHEYATHRPKEKKPYHKSELRGPANLIVFSDGGVFDIANVPVTQLLKENPYMTWDTALTGGQGSPLHAAMETATAGARKHQTPLCTEISTDGDMLRHLAEMLKDRVKLLHTAFSTKNIFPVTNADCEKAFGKNLVTMGEPAPKRKSHLAEIRAHSNQTEIG